MPDKKAPRKGTRIKVDKLQKEEKELSKEKQKKVKGGATRKVDETTAREASIWPADREN